MNWLKRIFKRLTISFSYRNIFILSDIARELQFVDDFEWDNYANTRDYVSNIGPFGTNFDRDFCIHIASVRHSFDKSKFEFEYLDERYLYPTHELILRLAFKLKPDGIFEFGCGSCSHLLNLQHLLPKTSLAGADISQKMRDLAERESSNLADGNLEAIGFFEHDLTLPSVTDKLRGQYELVYCHQVLLHIHRPNAAENFIKNMFEVSTRYILMVEDFNRHSLYRLVKSLFPAVKIYLFKTEYALAMLIDKLDDTELPEVPNDRYLRKVKKITEGKFQRFVDKISKEKELNENR